MASVQTTKVVERTSSSSSGGARTGGSRYSEEYSTHSSSGSALSGGLEGQSSRVVYSAPVSTLQQYSSGTHSHTHSGTHTHHHGGVTANELRSSQKIITETEDQRMLFGEDAAKFILETREREKRELSTLNDRLAAYLEKMHHLEMQNQNMGGLKERWEQDLITIKQNYEHQLASTQKGLDDTGRIKASLEAQIARLVSESAEYRKKYDEIVLIRDDNKGRVDGLLKKLGETETELNILRRNVQTLEDEVARLKGENARLNAALLKAKADLDQESVKAIDYQNQIQALLKKIDFIKHEHELEVKLISNQKVSVTGTAEYQDELAKAIREIRKEFDEISNKNKFELENWYTRKVTEITQREGVGNQQESLRLSSELNTYRSKITEYEGHNARLKSELSELQALLDGEKRRFEHSLSDFQLRITTITSENRSLQEKLKALFETNQTLYAEIAIYRKLLDGEEGRYSTRIQETVVKSAPVVAAAESVHVLKEEMVTHTSFQRSNKGNIQFAEIAGDGKYIVLENLSVNKDEHMGDWKLTRVIDNDRELVFTFPHKFHLKAGKSVRIWAKGQHGSNNLVDSLVYEGGSSWGVGFNVTTSLFNRDGEEKASYIQTTTTSQRTLQSS
jgi:intermediate filament protein if